MVEKKKQGSDLRPNSSPLNNQANDSELEKLSFEEALTELEQIVTDLESGSYTLEETLRSFQRGQRLAQHCARLLEKADLIIKRISTETGDESIPDLQ